MTELLDRKEYEQLKRYYGSKKSVHRVYREIPRIFTTLDFYWKQAEAKPKPPAPKTAAKKPTTTKTTTTKAAAKKATKK
jgi:hypothetical protein